MSTHRVPFDVCYSDMTARIVTRWKVILWKVEGGGGGGGGGMLLPTSPQLWEGALRDDTKNGCVVADYTFTNSIQN